MFYNKKKLKILESELSCYKSDYNHLREFITTLINKNQEQQQRIDKAIEYIKNEDLYIYEPDNDLGMDYERLANEELLEILGDKENDSKESKNKYD